MRESMTQRKAAGQGTLRGARIAAMRRAVRSAAIALLAIAIASSARAQDLEQGIAAYYSADFERALEAFRRAEREGPLTRDEVVRLFFFRALVQSAFDDEQELDRDLRRLASLEPEHAMNEAPPAVRARFAEIVRALEGPLRLEVSLSPTAGGALVRARVVNDAEGVVRSLEMSGGSTLGEAERRDEASLFVRGSARTPIHYSVRAIGPGGAVLDESVERDVPIPRDPSELARPEPVRGDDTVLHWAIGSGVAIAVIAALVVTLSIALAPASDQTQLSAPMFRP
jgi:hypothetical protein